MREQYRRLQLRSPESFGEKYVEAARMVATICDESDGGHVENANKWNVEWRLATEDDFAHREARLRCVTVVNEENIRRLVRYVDILCNADYEASYRLNMSSFGGKTVIKLRDSTTGEYSIPIEGELGDTPDKAAMDRLIDVLKQSPVFSMRTSDLRDTQSQFDGIVYYYHTEDEDYRGKAVSLEHVAQKSLRKHTSWHAFIRGQREFTQQRQGYVDYLREDHLLLALMDQEQH